VSGVFGGVGLLAVLAATVGLGWVGWLIGLAGVAVLNAALALGLHRHAADRLGPAGGVTLTRATLAVGVAALVAGSFENRLSLVALVGITTLALVLDGVDGAIARRTDTVTALGARFDMEVDAFLILVLSVFVAEMLGPWTLLIGAARYLSAVAGWLVPWLRRPVPPRFWRKVVAATQGIVLTVVSSGLLPAWLSAAAVAVALALLIESFGWDVVWLARTRSTRPVSRPVARRVAAPVV
jgi:phosphatidylglycerophosphate synthase